MVNVRKLQNTLKRHVRASTRKARQITRTVIRIRQAGAGSTVAAGAPVAASPSSGLLSHKICILQKSSDKLPRLIENLKGQAQSLGVRALQAFVSDPDHFKKQVFLAAGLQPLAQLPGHLQVDGQNLGVTLLETRLLPR